MSVAEYSPVRCAPSVVLWRSLWWYLVCSRNASACHGKQKPATELFVAEYGRGQLGSLHLKCAGVR